MSITYRHTDRATIRGPIGPKNAHYIKKIKVVDKTKGQIMPSNNSATSQGRMTVTAAAAAVHQLPSPI